jgi:hypothetical protein
MFTRSAPLIANNLWQGGMSQAQSSSVAGALGQCNAPLEHRAPVTVDYTSPNMTYIDASTATYEFPTYSMNPPEALPEKPPTRAPEELPPWEPEPFEPGPPIDAPPGYYPEWPGTGGGGGSGGGRRNFARAGKYLRVPSPATVELAYASDKEGNICTFKGGKISGIDYGELQEEMEKWNNNNPGEGNNRSITVVTDVQLTANGLTISKLEGVQVIYGGGEAEHDIPIIDCANP